MSQTVKRRIPVSPCDIAGIETWLSELSGQGLAFERFGPCFTYFRRCEPCEMLYRLEPLTRPGDPEPEMLEWYRQNGWEYVATLNRLFFIFRAKPGTPEIHSDAVTQGYTFEKLSRSLRSHVILIGVFIVMIFGMSSSVFLFSDWPILQLVDGSSLAVNHLLLILVELGTLMQLIQSYRAIHRLMKGLKAGLPMNHHRDFHKGRGYQTVFYALLITAAVCSIALSLGSILLRSEHALSQAPSPLPLLPLNAVEQDPSFSYHSELYEGRDWDNCVRYEWNILAPIQYRIEQRGIVPGKEWSDHSGEYSPSMRIQYYRLALPALADPLMNDLIYRYTVHFYQSRELVKMSLTEPGLDRAELFTGEGQQILFVRFDNQVMMVQYYGEGDLEGQIGEISTILANWSK